MTARKTVRNVEQPKGKQNKTTKVEVKNSQNITALADDEYMSPAQLDHFKKILLDWKLQIMSGADVTKTRMQEDLINYPDMVDRANQEGEFALELRTRDRERKLLRKIDNSLERIEKKEYGYCDDCGAEIGLKRLEARPTATQCVECKTIAEMKERQLGGDDN